MAELFTDKQRRAILARLPETQRATLEDQHARAAEALDDATNSHLAASDFTSPADLAALDVALEAIRAPDLSGMACATFPATPVLPLKPGRDLSAWRQYVHADPPTHEHPNPAPTRPGWETSLCDGRLTARKVKPDQAAPDPRRLILGTDRDDLLKVALCPDTDPDEAASDADFETYTVRPVPEAVAYARAILKAAGVA